MTFLTRLFAGFIGMLMLFVTDCAPAEYDENAVHIVIKLMCSRSVACVSAEYSLDGETRGVGSVMNARESMPLPMGDELHFEYRREDFGDRESDGHQLTIDVTVTDMTGTQHSAGSYTCTIGYGDVHCLVLTDPDGVLTLQEDGGDVYEAAAAPGCA